jgi:hypothetical protein
MSDFKNIDVANYISNNSKIIKVCLIKFSNKEKDEEIEHLNSMKQILKL